MKNIGHTLNHNVALILCVLTLAPFAHSFKSRSVVEKDNLMLLGEGAGAGFIAASSAMKFSNLGYRMIEEPQTNTFNRLGVLLGWAYAVRKLAPHSHKCLNLQAPKRTNKEEVTGKSVTAFIKGLGAGYIALTSLLRGATDLRDLTLEHDGQTPRHSAIDIGGALGHIYTTYKLAPYSYRKLKSALS